eukprot:gb/GEZN01001216.1/.p1 GENE.gb/GEZN01001216.1/~~gb/GEZN01001216.1/.p1  ORF type:complete len:501 (-),score=98.75 gb/GEZN01001216.1/:1713-3035(-)
MKELKPASLKTNVQFNHSQQVLSALAAQDRHGKNFEYALERGQKTLGFCITNLLQSNGHTIKFEIAKIPFKAWEKKENVDQLQNYRDGTMYFLRSVYTYQIEIRGTNKQLNRTVQDLEAQVQNATALTLEATKVKDFVEEDLYDKFQRVLAAKKQRLKRLAEENANLLRQNRTLQDSLQQEERKRKEAQQQDGHNDDEEQNPYSPQGARAEEEEKGESADEADDLKEDEGHIEAKTEQQISEERTERIESEQRTERVVESEVASVSSGGFSLSLSIGGTHASEKQNQFAVPAMPSSQTQQHCKQSPLQPISLGLESQPQPIQLYPSPGSSMQPDPGLSQGGRPCLRKRKRNLAKPNQGPEFDAPETFSGHLSVSAGQAAGQASISDVDMIGSMDSISDVSAGSMRGKGRTTPSTEKKTASQRKREKVSEVDSDNLLDELE